MEETTMQKIKNDYFSFNGRLNRKPYIIRSLIVGVITGVIIGFLMVFLGNENIAPDTIRLISFILEIPAIIVSLSLGIRRLHDLNMPGILILLQFIPYVNIIVSLILILMPGKLESNKYGVSPL